MQMDAIREYLAKLGKKGGKARAKNLTASSALTPLAVPLKLAGPKTRKLVDKITEGTKVLEHKVRESKRGL